MKNKMLIITATHNRPKAFAALERWVKNQTYNNFDWLVVCDSDAKRYKFRLKQQVIERDPSNDTLPSICHNYLEALKVAQDYPKTAILEDDDWYCPTYLYEMDKMLTKHDLAGFHEDAYYYVLSRRAKRFHNVGHASLAATGFTPKAIPWLKECCERGEMFIDINAWLGWPTGEDVVNERGIVLRPAPRKSFPGKKVLAHNFTGLTGTIQPALDRHGNITPAEYPRHIGIKENWHGGASGLSEFGHTAEGSYDVYGKLLQTWMGETDAAFYLKLRTPPKYGSLAATGMFLPDPEWDPLMMR